MFCLHLQWNIHFDPVKSMTRMGVHDMDRMEQMKIRKLINNIGGLLSPDDIAASTKSLIVLLRSAPEKKSIFFAEGGIVGIMGLVYSAHHKVSYLKNRHNGAVISGAPVRFRC